jgi:hypothetical protein
MMRRKTAMLWQALTLDESVQLRVSKKRSIKRRSTTSRCPGETADEAFVDCRRL